MRSPLGTALLLVRIALCVDALCRPVPGTPDWPCPAEWQCLNVSVSHQLLKPIPPAAPCHPGEPSYDNATCQDIQTQWVNGSFHANNPISVDSNNWSNDSCLPVSTGPCSGEGYPVYVINATSVAQVQAGVNFARKHNVRLVVKASGHDYLGRSIAPYSLSIWVRNLRGIKSHNSFQPKGCTFTIKTTAVTAAGGELWGDVYTAVAKLKQVVVGATPATVGVVGQLTGGGHSPLSAIYGTAADQVLEMEVVTPAGKLVTANECQNSDLFWALRGGGGSTFGVVTSTTIKTFPTMPVAYLSLFMIGKPNSPAYWEMNSYLLSKAPEMVNSGIFGYIYTGGSVSGVIPGVTEPASGYLAEYVAPNKTLDQVAAVLGPIYEYVNTTWGNQFSMNVTPGAFPDFNSWWVMNNVDLGVGVDNAVGSRLLDGQALSAPLATWNKSLQEITPPGGIININLVSGPGTWHAVPRGGNNSINPAWRKAYVHFAISAKWNEGNKTAERAALDALTYQQTPPLAKFANSSGNGCYINEANAFEPKLSEVFWGTNYPRLLKIKRAVDPTDVFWCAACVGRERWAVNKHGVLCTV